MTTLTVDAPTLAERLGNSSDPDPTLIDVRTPAEFEAGHIPGAVNVPLDELKGSLDQLCAVLDDHHDVVLVCRSGARAGQAETALAGAGRTDLRVLDGGMVAWEQAGAPVNRGRKTWDIERQVRFVAGSVVATSVLGSHFAPRLKWLAAGLGTGLVTAAVTNSCAMGAALSRMPWNQAASAPDIADVLADLTSD